MNINNLPEPFKTAFENGKSIDYTTIEAKDHDYVKERGYKPQINIDCSFTAKGLPGFSLSSYGDWGTFYPKWASDNEKEMFFDMLDKHIIRLWRV